MSASTAKSRRRGPARSLDVSSGDPGEAAPAIDLVDLTPRRPIGVSVEETREDGAHVHLALEVGMVLSGRVEENHGESWFSLGPGQVWACRSFEVHRWHVVRPAVELRFDFLPSLFSRMPDLEGFNPWAVFRNPIRSSAIGSTRAARRSLAALGRELAGKYRGPVSPAQAYIDLLRFLEAVGDEAEATATPSPQPWSDLAAGSRIQPALALIECSPDRRVEVVKAARACNMARSSFERRFRQITGFGFAEFSLRSRLAQAAQALRATDSPVKVVARRFGFADASHFHHAFVTYYGMAPRRYRMTCTGLAGPGAPQ